jgi:hypothetical protein
MSSEVNSSETSPRKVETMTRKINTGDVIEFEAINGATTAIVLLVSEHTAILDLLDGDVPWVVDIEALGAYRVFEAETLVA